MGYTMSAWTLRPPAAPGRYDYREHRYEPIRTFDVVEVEGEMMAELPNVWMFLRELDGEWRRVLTVQQYERLSLKGRA